MAPAKTGVEGAVLVLVVREVDGGTAPRADVTSVIPWILVTLEQGRALKQGKLEVSNKDYERENRSHMSTSKEEVIPSICLKVQRGLRIRRWHRHARLVGVSFLRRRSRLPLVRHRQRIRGLYGAV